MTDEELRTITWNSDGTVRWHLTPRGWSNGKPRHYHRTLSADAAEPLLPQGGTDVPDDPENAVGVPSGPVEEASEGHSFPFKFWKHKHNKDQR